MDLRLPCSLWPVGQVIQVHPGSGGCVQSVEVRVQSQTYVCRVAQTVPLPELKEYSGTPD